MGWWNMSSKTFYKVSGTVFGIVGIAHLLRALLGWGLVIGPYNIPGWLSLVAFVVLAFLSYSAFKLAGVLK